jgi:hypothetical protein
VSFWAYPEYTTEENRLICQKGTLEALFRAAALVFISQSSRDDFEKLFPGLCDRRKILSTVALLASRFPHVSGPRRGIDSGGWLAVGSLEPRKNYDILLDALRAPVRVDHGSCAEDKGAPGSHKSRELPPAD